MELHTTTFFGFLEFIGTTELLVIMLVALLVFGPRKLPELGRSLGRTLNQVRAASDDFKRTWEAEALQGGGATARRPTSDSPIRGAEAERVAVAVDTAADDAAAGAGPEAEGVTAGPALEVLPAEANC